MSKLVVAALGIAVTGGAVVAAPSGAQDPPVTTVTAEAKVTPDKPGTKKKPRGVKLETIEGLDNYHFLPTVRADFLAKLGRNAEAIEDLRHAAQLTQNPAQLRVLGCDPVVVALVDLGILLQERDGLV